ncbi:Ig-like domain-containing protein [Pseudomonadales bacterium]|nr:Ig-like domain-containing protein [Pseudomonadales bacterium]
MRISTVVKYLTFISTLMLLNACGGGGSSAVPSPTVSIGASGSSIELNNSLDLSWSSTSAESCTASNDWTGVKSTSGSEALTLSSLGDQTFTLTCRNSSGSTSQSVEVEVYRIVTGVVVDGYITGSSVFCDTNGNLSLDAGEESVTSASDGSFSVRAGVCNLVSLGGFDTDMNNALDDLLLVTPLRASQAVAAVSPITTVASFMDNPEDLNAILGVDPSIDLMTTDLVAKKGTSDEYDLLYEKGNQLTVLAYSLQKATGEVGDDSKDAFSSITKVLEDTYELSEGKVDIESNAFLETVVEAVATTSGASLSSEIKSNITTVLANVLPLIQVRDDNKASQDILNFATDTLLNDIEKIADGSASAATLEQYTTQATSYIATSQGGSASDYALSITAIEDSVSTPEDTNVLIKIISNDDYVSDGEAIEITLAEAAYGSLSLDADNQVTYIPLADYTGADTFTYTLKQGEQSSTAEVTVTVTAVADAPKLTLTSNALSIAENTSAVGTFKATDADGDALTYSLSGTDAGKFSISSTGELKLEAAADYEGQSSYSLTISVSDGSETVSEDLTIAITNVIETAPALTLPATISIAENTSIVTQAVATDSEGSAITYALSGADAATFYLTSTGLVSFRTVPDYESLSKTQYNITVTVTNAGGLTASGAMVVNVTDISENFFDTCRFGECKFE